MKWMFQFLILLVASSCFALDHEYKKYGEILETYVRDGLVDYRTLKANRPQIDTFIKEISSVEQDEYNGWTRSRQLAFWINTYNGWFLRIVIDHYPIQKTRLIGFIYPENSVQQIAGIWDKTRLRAAGRQVSLNDIEHNILRAQFKEPRVHFAIVCASIGCPLLKNEPYLPEILESQLEASVRDFVMNPAKILLNREKNKISLSKIFKWFVDDFASFADDGWKKVYSEEAGPVAFVSKYLPAGDAAFISTRPLAVDYLEYDWSLNEARP